MSLRLENKVAYVTKNQEIKIVDEIINTCSEDSVIVQVHYCGICGSDMPRYFDNGVHFYPIVLGHEFSGVVEFVGKGVKNLHVGDHVAGVPLVPCMDCSYCLSGKYQLCNNYSFIGSRQSGAFQKYLHIKSDNVFKLNNNTDLQSAAFMEPITVGIHGVNSVIKHLTKNSKIAVIGLGVIGYCTLTYLHFKGYSDLTVIRRNEKRDHLINNLNIKFSTFEQLDAKFDCIIDCSMMNDISLLIESLNNSGSISFVGTKHGKIELDDSHFNMIQRKELTITGSWMSYSNQWPGKEWFEAEELINSNLYNFRNLINRIFNIYDINEAFKFAKLHGPKVLVSPHEI